MSYRGRVTKQGAAREERKLRNFTVGYLSIAALSLIGWVGFGNVHQVSSNHF